MAWAAESPVKVTDTVALAVAAWEMTTDEPPTLTETTNVPEGIPEPLTNWPTAMFVIAEMLSIVVLVWVVPVTITKTTGATANVPVLGVSVEPAVKATPPSVMVSPD